MLKYNESLNKILNLMGYSEAVIEEISLLSNNDFSDKNKDWVICELLKEKSSLEKLNNEKSEKKLSFEEILKQENFEFLKKINVVLDSVLDNLQKEYNDNNKLLINDIFNLYEVFLRSSSVLWRGEYSSLEDLIEQKYKYRKICLEKENVDNFNILDYLSKFKEHNMEKVFNIFNKEMDFIKEYINKDFKNKCEDFCWEYIIENAVRANIEGEVIFYMLKYRKIDRLPKFEQIFELQIENNRLICYGKKAFDTCDIFKNVYKYDLVTKFLKNFNGYLELRNIGLKLNSDKNSDILLNWPVVGDEDDYKYLVKNLLEDLIDYRLNFAALDLYQGSEKIINNIVKYDNLLMMNKKIEKSGDKPQQIRKNKI